MGLQAFLARYRNGSDDAYEYTYDDNGNITSITRGTTSVTYEYNGVNELIRENNGFTNQTVTYTYDSWGNLTEKSVYAYTTAADPGTPISMILYGYTNTAWGDQLTSYDGQTIVYDAMGNPTTYRGKALTWRGKQLTGVSGGTHDYSFTYDSNGLRQQKTEHHTDPEDDIHTNYYYNGSVLIGLVKGNDTLRFSYDAAGLVQAVDFNGTYYYYLRNGQGDIVKLIDGSKTTVVEYTYDSWGKQLSCTGTLATTLGVLNPFRYRGYVYDEETGFYYLKSRYYDPETCRFISADVLLSTGQGVLGYNCFVYSLNNPVVWRDPNGSTAEDDDQETSLANRIVQMIKDSIETAILLCIAQGLQDGSTGRLALEKAATLTSKKYIKAKENKYMCNQFVAEAFSGIKGYKKIKDRSTTGIYEFFEGSIQSSNDATVAIDLSNAEIGAILFFSYPGCNNCDRCKAGRAQGMHIHHVGIYIGKINGIDYMVDNGPETDVSIRPVSAVTPGNYGEYYCTAYMNPF